MSAPLQPNPRYCEFCATLAKHPQWLTPWSGLLFRFQSINFPSAGDILSGIGARVHGGRWSPPGIAAVYGSCTDITALEESKANDRYYGVVTLAPRVLVAIETRLNRVLDLRRPSIRRALGLSSKALATENWRKQQHAGYESQTQALGRAAAECGSSGLLVHSAAIRQGINGIIFPHTHPDDRIQNIRGEKLERLRLQS